MSKIFAFVLSIFVFNFVYAEDQWCVAMCQYQKNGQRVVTNVDTRFNYNIVGLVGLCEVKAREAGGAEPITYTSVVQTEKGLYFNFDARAACYPSN